MNVKFPITYDAMRGALVGCRGPDIEDFSVRNCGTRFDNDPIRAIERASIRWWMEQQAPYLTGRVLDFGCGKPGTCAVPQPYRDIVEKAGGEYVGVDVDDPMPYEPLYDTIICNQVVQYLETTQRTLNISAFQPLRDGGRLILTYATCWPPSSEENDYWRHTPKGVDFMLRKMDLEIEEHITRAVVRVAGREFPLGGAIRGRKS